MIEDHGPCEIVPRKTTPYICPYCGIPPEPYSRYHEGPAACEEARRRKASAELSEIFTSTSPPEQTIDDPSITREEVQEAAQRVDLIEILRKERLEREATVQRDGQGYYKSGTAFVSENSSPTLSSLTEEVFRLTQENERLTRELRHALANKEQIQSSAETLLKLKEAEIERLRGLLKTTEWETTGERVVKWDKEQTDHLHKRLNSTDPSL